MGRDMIHLESEVVSVRPVGLLDAGVAVTAAVSIYLIRRPVQGVWQVRRNPYPQVSIC
jgi:Na+/serine symporter